MATETSTEISGVGKMTNMGVRREPTNIDRRGAKRKVPMKVLALGLGRTGTTSLRAALLQLGYIDTYHMTTMMMENPPDAIMWEDAMRRKFEGSGPPFTRQEWDSLLGECMAVCDWPPVAFSDELIEAYPEAKIILSVRDSPEAWHKSVMNTIYGGYYAFGPGASWFMWIVQTLTSNPQKRAMKLLYSNHIMTGDFPTEGPRKYVEYNEHIRKIAPKERFLEFNAKQGWGPLCEFLEVPVPDTPFPRVNDSESFQKAFAKLKKDMGMQLVTGSLIGISCIGAVVAGVMFASNRM